MIQKEFRALLPAWFAVAVAMVGAHQSGRSFAFLAGPAFIIGAAALGSLSFGQEYSYRTVGLMLTLPVPRGRIWASKLLVLFAFVAGLAMLAFYLQPFAKGPQVRVLVITVLAAMGIAPWLAMLSRSALGGAVFAVSIPGTLFVLSQIVGTRLYGFTQQTDDFIVTVMAVAVILLSALGLVLGWRTFTGLEAIDGRGAEVALLPTARAASADLSMRRSHPIWLLVKKELRLQQMTMVLAVIFVAIYVSLVLFSRDRNTVDNALTLVTVLYTAVMGVMIGALAGGEERQLGVHDSQLLLPMSSRHQWIVKAGASLGLGVVLTILLPLILVAVLPPEGLHSFGRRGLISGSSITLLASLVTLGLYVSVVAGSGVRGLIAAVPVGMTILYCFLEFIVPLTVQVARYTRTETTDRLIYYEPLLPRGAEPYAFALVFGLFLVVVLRLALTNYRWTDRSPLRLASHVAIAIATLTACFTLLAVLGIR